eukprot:403354818
MRTATNKNKFGVQHVKRFELNQKSFKNILIQTKTWLESQDQLKKSFNEHQSNNNDNVDSNKIGLPLFKGTITLIFKT